jgi:hypothetical protein
MAAELKLFSDSACTTELTGSPYNLRIGPETGLNGTAGEIAISTIYLKNTGDVLISNVVLTETQDTDGRAQYCKGGVAQIETATVAVSTVTNGSITVTVAGASVGSSPKELTVTVASGDTASDVAGKIRTAMNATTDITTNYTVGGTGANVTLTAKATAANDTSLNIAITGSNGITEALTSANTLAGVADGSYSQTSVSIGEVSISAIIPIRIKITVDALTPVHVDEPANFSISGTHLA